MEGFTIASDRIATAASGVEQIGHTLNQEIATMHDLLADISAGWQSSTAAPRFAQAMEGYLDQAKQLTTALLSHGESLATTGRTFEQAEQAIFEQTPVGA